MENVMFKKVPYGVKVRVRGNDESGYIAEYATYCSRFFAFMNTWTVIRRLDTNTLKVLETYTTFYEAKDAALLKYDGLIRFYQGQEEEERIAENMAKISKTPVWEHP
jgi:hypothetical protein